MTDGLLENIWDRIDRIERRLGLNSFEQALINRLSAVESKLDALTQQGVQVMAEIDDLVAQVQETKGVEEAATLALRELRDRIDAIVQSATDLAQLKAQLSALTTDLDTSERALATAIATPPPAPEPATPPV